MLYGLIVLLGFYSCANATFEKTNNGIIVRIEKTNEKVRLVVFNDQIIRVSVTKPGSDFMDEKSLVVNMEPNQNVEWDVTESSNKVVLSTSVIKAEVDKTTGEVQFLDLLGQVVLKEEKGGGRLYGKAVNPKLPETTLQQVFNSPDDEAFYGLGQHQNGEVNYKGLDIELLQNNIVAVVPFLYSSKNYGLLWDNYSVTRFGDPRDYEPISSLTLFDDNGNQGGLMVNYYDRDDHLFVSQRENNINYSTLDEQGNYPAGFKLSDRSTVVWEGAIQSDKNGVHKFKLWAASYFKVWVDGELIFDKWRQCWNPWYNKFYIDMKAGEKHQLKIEWKPDADVSYIGLTYLDPSYSEKQNMLSLSSETGKQIDYYYIKGNNADDIISGYRELTGKAPIVPKWAMGLWQSRERYKRQDELVNVVKEYRKRKIPFDNIVLDWSYWPVDKWGDHDFDPKYWPDPEKMISDVHELNAHIMISVWPKFYVGTENFKRFEKNGWLYMKNVELGNKDWIAPGYLSTFYDAYNPDAREAFWDGLNTKLFSKGIDAWWLDATEPDIHSNVTLAERKSTMTPNYLGTGTEYFNTYSLMQAKGVYEGQRKADPNKRVFILTRSAFAGQQRYGAATWSGDIVSRWSDLRDQWAAGINMGLSGIPYWTTDIGGFDLEKRYIHPNQENLKEWRELNTRWFQFGAFCPIFRIHGKFPFREIWNIAPKGTPEYNSMVYYDELRYRMMPYIYSLAGAAYHQNATILRGLVMDFDADEMVHNITDQFMFGKAFMVCPVGHYQQRERSVYLPETTGWFNFYSNKYFEGGQTIQVKAPLEQIPLFVKAGSIVPFGPEVQYATDKTNGNLKLFVYTGADASFTLYEDENTNYNYEKGAYEEIQFDYNEQNKTFTISTANGSFEGMATQRVFEIYFLDKDGIMKFNLSNPPSKTVIYNGNKIVVTRS